MRVLHVISSGGMYGAETMILELMRALERAGDASLVAIFDNRSAPNEEFPEAARRAGVAVERLICKGQVDASVPGQIAALVRRWDADVVHTHGYKGDLYTAAAMRGRRGTRPALLATCHGWIDSGRVVKAYGWLDRRVLRGFDAVTAVSDAVVDRLLSAGVPRARVHLVANGLDAQPFAEAVPGLGQSVEELPLVAQVGRLSREKGADVFLRMMAMLRREGVVARGVLWGEGPQREELEALRRELGLDDLVAMPGRRDDMAAALAEVDVLVNASRQEGLPMSLLEGMASGRAIVATAVGKVPEVLEDGATGMLASSEDVERLAASTGMLLRDAARRSALGTAARAAVEEQFSARAMAANYRQLYAASLARVRGAA